MFGKRLLALAMLMGLASGPVLAQSTTGTTQAHPAPATAAPSATTGTTATAKTTPAAKPTAATPVNLNTATAAQLDTLPGIGKRRSKVILDARAKGGNFKDWDDFDKRMASTSVNAGVKAKIKSLVTF